MSLNIAYNRLQDVLPFMDNPERTPVTIPDNLHEARLIIASRRRRKLPFVPNSARESKIGLLGLPNHLGIVYKGVYKRSGGNRDSSLSAVYSALIPGTSRYLEESINGLLALTDLPSRNLPNYEAFAQIKSHPTATPTVTKFIIAQEAEAAQWMGDYAKLRPSQQQQKLLGAACLVGNFSATQYLDELNLAIDNLRRRSQFWIDEHRSLKGNPLVEAIIERELEKQQTEAETEEILTLASEVVE